MSHIKNLNERKQLCQSTSQCNEYETLLQHENQQIDSYTASSIQSAVIWGFMIGIIGLTVLLTPFVKPIKALQKFIFPKLVILMPLLAGITAGTYAGFMIAFYSCYKQPCSPLELYAMILIPVATLILTIPLAIKIATKRKLIVESMDKAKPLVWVIIGILIITGAIIFTVSKISESNKTGEAQKQYLLNSEL